MVARDAATQTESYVYPMYSRPIRSIQGYAMSEEKARSLSNHLPICLLRHSLYNKLHLTALMLRSALTYVVLFYCIYPLQGYDLSEEESRSLSDQLSHHARKRLEGHVREAAATRLARMKDR